MNSKEVERISSDNLDKLFIIQKKQFHQGLREMKRLVKIWRNNELEVKADNSQKAILIQYCAYLEQTNNIDTLKGPTFVKHISYKQDLKDVKKESDIFLGVGLLQQKEWKLNFNKKFIKKLKCLSEQLIMDIFLKFRLFTEGFIHFGQGKFNSLEEYPRINRFGMKYYTHRLDIDKDNIYFMLISIGVNQIPSYKFNGEELQSFSYVQVITCEDIIHSTVFKCEKKMIDVIELLEDQYEEDPKICYLKEDLIDNKESKGQNNKQKKKTEKQPIEKIYPKRQQKKIISLPKNNEISLQIQNFRFLMKKYLDYQIRCQYFNIVSNDKPRLNSIEQLEILTAKNQIIQFKEHGNIIQDLQKIPNFKFLLTKQQKSVLRKNGNLIIVGRSGTGKTTCALLRLYGIQTAAKKAEQDRLRQQQQISQQDCIRKMIDEILLTRNIFLTFSSILIEQIKKQYDNIVYQVRLKHSIECRVCSLTQNPPEIEDNEDPIDRIKKLENQQQKKIISLNSIQAKDFPGFYTIQSFLRIIDKTIIRPFFSQEKQIKNEKMAEIKQAYINLYEYGPKDIILLQTYKAVYVDYQFFLHFIWEKLPKELSEASRQFYLLTPSVVWAQIFSILKGSIKSYQCPQGFISLKMYFESSQSIFHLESQKKMQQYKKKVYKILKKYTEWLKDKKAYDLMDVVSHNLRQIQFYGYQGPKINYMFIDQVQDLTESTIFLISKTVINNILYCGDAAQAITKGVSFRFEELKLLFNKKYFKHALNLEPPEGIQHLTVNFRSHHSILELANSIVSAIEIFFPNNINKLKKQKSDLIGPKPFVILNQDQSMIFQLVCGSIEENKPNRDIDLRLIVQQRQSTRQKQIENRRRQKKRQIKSSSQLDPRKFNHEQVIIVRNSQQQQKLPPSLKKGIVLTPQKAKGLEYDQIILYNFFSSSPIYQKWNYLFEHLQCIQQNIEEKQFEENISRKGQIQNENQYPIKIQTKILLGYDQQTKKYNIWSVRPRQSMKGVLINAYYEIITQLKIFYTAITRARSVFIIFDSKIPNSLLKLWSKMKLVTNVDAKNVELHHKSIYGYVKENRKHIKYLNQSQYWFKAGCQMLARKDYQNAKKCYKNIERIDLVERIQAIQQEVEGQRLLYLIKSQLEKSATLPKENQKIIKIRLEKQKKLAFQKYRNAVKIYERYRRYKDAADVYVKIQQYQLALRYYRLEKDKSCSLEIAVCCKHLKRYDEALVEFKNLKNVEGIIECYIELKQWSLLFEQFVSHPEYINQYKECNISMDCVKNVLHQTIKNKIKQIFLQTDQLRKQKSFQDTLKIATTHIQDTTINNQSKQINILIMQRQYKYVRWLNQQFECIRMKYLQMVHHQNTLQSNNQRLQKQKKMQQQAKKNILFESNILNDEIAFLKSILKRYQQHFIKDFKSISKYQESFAQLNMKQKQKPHLSKRIDKIIQKQATIRSNLQENKEAIKKLNENRNIFEKKYKVNHQMLRFNKLQSLFSKLLKDVESLSQRSIYKIQGQRIYDDCQLLNRQKRVSQISQILIVSQNFIKYKAQQKYSPFHHKFIEQELGTSFLNKTGLSLLKKCSQIGDNLTCIIVCYQFTELIVFSPKFILGLLLQTSKNFKQNRHLKYQSLQSIQSQFSLVDKIFQNWILRYVQRKMLRVHFQKTFYYESTASHLAFGLILQGHIQQVFKFIKSNDAWKLAYLFSLNQIMAEILKKSIKQFGTLSKFFCFVQQPLILKQYHQARMLNIFTIQQIFFMYDECQDQSFLSIKKQLAEFQIQQELISQFQSKALIEVEELKKQNSEIKQQIKQKQWDIKRNEQKIKEANCNLAQAQEKKNQLRKNRRQIKLKIQQKQQIFFQLQQKYKQAKANCDKSMISLQQKEKYQQKITQLQIKLQSAKNEYSNKISIQKKATDTLKDIQSQIHKIQAQLEQLQNIMVTIKQSMPKFESKILVYTSNLKKYKHQIGYQKDQLELLRRTVNQQVQTLEQRQLTQLVFKRLLKEQKQARYQDYIEEIREQNMYKLNRRLFFPRSKHYQFIKFYLNQEDSQKYPKQRIWQLCTTIFKDTQNLLYSQQQESQQILMRYSNAIMLYLSYIFNSSFRKEVQACIQQSSSSLNNFLHNMFQKIKSVNSSKGIFINLLLGFFQCKIIQQCYHLDFLSDEYVLVKNGSIILQKFKKNMFAYYFDQQNRNILCTFQDVLLILTGYIIQRHSIVFDQIKENQELAESIRNNSNKIQKTLRSAQQLEEGKQLNEFNQLIAQDQRQIIQQTYQRYFLNTHQIIATIRKQRRKQLEYFLSNKLQNPQFYHFFNFQLREYYFVQKMLISIKSFNYYLLKELKQKIKMLQQQSQKFMQNNVIKNPVK